MKTSWLGPNAPKFLTLCISSSSGSLWCFPSPGGGSFSDGVMRGHFSVTFLGQHLSVCFSSRPVVCAVSGSGLLSQGQVWVSVHGVGLNSRATVVTPATLGLVLEYCIMFISWSLCKSSNVLYLTPGHSWFFSWGPSAAVS